jgi:hypothetical protein
MKRLLTCLAMLLMAGAAFAFDPAPGKQQIGLLRAADSDGNSYPRNCVVQALRDELRHRGFEVVDVPATLEEVGLDPDRDADYYVDVASDGNTDDYGGVGIGGYHGSVSMGVLVSRVAADMRVYRGRTLEVLDTASVAKKNMAVLPTSVGVGGANVFAVFAMPFVERAQVRSVARAAAREMADRIVAAAHPE